MANTILNGDVADCYGNNGRPIHWGIYGVALNWGASNTEYVSSPCSAYFTAQARDGATVSSINCGLIAGDSSVYSSAGAYTLFGGQNYHLEFDIKHSFNQISVELVWWDINNIRAFKGLFLENGQTRVLNTNGLWEHHTADFLMPANAVLGVLLLRDDEAFPLGTVYSGTCYLDNVMLDTGYVPPPCANSVPCFTHSEVSKSASFDAACTQGGTSSDGIVHPIKTYTWKFGDGTTGTGQKVLHQYSQDGIYIVELSTQNDCEATSKTYPDFVTIATTQPPPTQQSTGTASNSSTAMIIGAAVLVVVLGIMMNKK